MSKKKVLFIMESLGIGGAEKSLLTILNLLDYERYEVDLFLFSHTGDFINMIPKEVNLLEESENYKIFKQSRKLAPFRFLGKMKFKNFYHSSLYLVKCAICKLTGRKLYTGWKHVSNFFENIQKEYDTSVAFLERKTIYFNVDKVKSKNKIGFIHNDYSIYPYEDKLDRVYFKEYNHIATVSDHCKDVLMKIFPEYKEKFLVIKNMVSEQMIKKLAQEKIDGFVADDNVNNIVSVGRLVKQKGFDRAIEISKELVKRNIDFKWYIVGEGEERANLTNIINSNNLNEKIILVGADTNPYRWMNIADIYVQPSRFEGYGITVAEAMALGKKIIASNIPEFRELLGEGSESLANSEINFADIIEEKTKSRARISNFNEIYTVNLSLEENKEELNKLYEVM